MFILYRLVNIDFYIITMAMLDNLPLALSGRLENEFAAYVCEIVLISCIYL